ncbi:hypothetical protein JW916_13870 [Candidatus Sumerlaeota bacterium]|nr:hypothetical protein [Candidatus Sumerlaeota bacterium]
MIKSFLKKKRNKGAGGSAKSGGIQDRIDAIRAKQDPSEEDSTSPNGGGAGKDEDSANGGANSEEEAFLKQFAERVASQPPRAAPSLPESLAESSREMREALAQRERNGGVVPPKPTPRPAPVAPPTPAPRPSQSVTPPPSSSSRATEPAPVSSGDLPPEGAILHLASGENLVFCRDVPNKTYQLVAVLNPDGSVHAEGVYLHAYEYRRIGMLAPDQLQEIREQRRWQRDLIVFHLDEVRDASLIPVPGGAGPAPERPPGSKVASQSTTETRPFRAEPAESEPDVYDDLVESLKEESVESPQDVGVESSPEEEEEGDIRGASSFGRLVRARKDLTRGRRFSIKFGNRGWEAVYWGEDEQGSVVAHNTNGQWSLMHLDLSRFRDSFALLGEISDKERTDLEKALRQSHR